MLDFDARVFRLVHQGLSGSLVLFVMAALTIVGSGWSMLALLPMLAMRRHRRVASSLALTLGATALVVATVKHFVGRVRPCACLDGIHARIFAPPTDPSFPSGHAAGAFAFAAFVAVALLRDPSLAADTRLRRWLVAASLFLVATGIALSRIVLGVHFPGDVSAGAALGGVLGALGGTLHLRAGASRRSTTVSRSE